MPFIFQLIRQPFQINFCLEGLIKLHFMAYFFIEALITIIIRNPKIFIIVPTGLQLIDWTISDSQMQVKCLPFPRVHADR